MTTTNRSPRRRAYECANCLAEIWLVPATVEDAAAVWCASCQHEATPMTLAEFDAAKAAEAMPARRQRNLDRHRAAQAETHALVAPIAPIAQPIAAEVPAPTPAAPAYRKAIRYDRKSRDFAMYIDGELCGYAPTYLQAETVLNQLVYDLLTDRATRRAATQERAATLDTGAGDVAVTQTLDTGAGVVAVTEVVLAEAGTLTAEEAEAVATIEDALAEEWRYAVVLYGSDSIAAAQASADLDDWRRDHGLPICGDDRCFARGEPLACPKCSYGYTAEEWADKLAEANAIIARIEADSQAFAVQLAADIDALAAYVRAPMVLGDDDYCWLCGVFGACPHQTAPLLPPVGGEGDDQIPPPPHDLRCGNCDGTGMLPAIAFYEEPAVCPYCDDDGVLLPQGAVDPTRAYGPFHAQLHREAQASLAEARALLVEAVTEAQAIYGGDHELTAGCIQELADFDAAHGVQVNPFGEDEALPAVPNPHQPPAPVCLACQHMTCVECHEWIPPGSDRRCASLPFEPTAEEKRETLLELERLGGVVDRADGVPFSWAA